MKAELQKVRRAAEAERRARARRSEAILAAAAAGATVRAIAAEAGLSFQRVHQIVHGR